MESCNKQYIKTQSKKRLGGVVIYSARRALLWIGQLSKRNIKTSGDICWYVGAERMINLSMKCQHPFDKERRIKTLNDHWVSCQHTLNKIVTRTLLTDLLLRFLQNWLLRIIRVYESRHVLMFQFVWPGDLTLCADQKIPFVENSTHTGKSSGVFDTFVNLGNRVRARQNTHWLVPNSNFSLKPMVPDPMSCSQRK